jgi:methionyl-tRNA formyltransferase
VIGLKIVFMGTPGFAVNILEKLLNFHEVLCVITQPDKPQGRKNIITPPPVKVFAEERGLAVLQPKRIRGNAFIAEFEQNYKNADVFCVAAFGQILPEKILSMPRFGCINVHASLLPKYRGAAPIQRAVIDGCQSTGVTIMKMDKGIDTGDMILQRELKIESSDTGGVLFEKLSHIGADALIEALAKIESGEAVFTPQSEDGASYAQVLTKETGRINFNLRANEIVNLIRALAPEMSAYGIYQAGTGDAAENAAMELKIWNAQEIDVSNLSSAKTETDISQIPNGRIVEINKNGIAVKTGDGILLLREVQPSSGKRMDAAAFARGRGVSIGGFFE